MNPKKGKQEGLSYKGNQNFTRHIFKYKHKNKKNLALNQNPSLG